MNDNEMVLQMLETMGESAMQRLNFVTRVQATVQKAEPRPGTAAFEKWRFVMERLEAVRQKLARA